MSATTASVLRLGRIPRARAGLAAVLGALTVLFGVGLMALAGYLISRAAEPPAGAYPLMIAITAVQFFGLGRLVLRYLEALLARPRPPRPGPGPRPLLPADRRAPGAPAQLSAYRPGATCSPGWWATSTPSRTSTSVGSDRRWSRSSPARPRPGWRLRFSRRPAAVLARRAVGRRVGGPGVLGLSRPVRTPAGGGPGGTLGRDRRADRRRLRGGGLRPSGHRTRPRPSIRRHARQAGPARRLCRRVGRRPHAPGDRPDGRRRARGGDRGLGPGTTRPRADRDPGAARAGLV